MPDWKRPASPLLPAFGIRDLNGPEAPPGVIQITGRQYNSTITSQPDATLRYLDDDDGEVITVGSSFELQQRLDDPFKRPSLSFPPTLCNENQMMHIFDIQKSAGSLAVWRDHEAYSSKSLREGSPSKDCTGDLNSPVSPISLEPSTPASPGQTKTQADNILATQQSPPLAEKNPLGHPTKEISSSSPSSSPHEQITVQLDQAFGSLYEGIQSQLGPLADFLETAAEGLRKAAEKTAESDTTAIENVLTGFKGIWSELGQMGCEFLDSIDEHLQKDHTPEDNTSIVHEPSSVPQSPCLKKAEASPKLETASKRVSFNETPTAPAEHLSTESTSINDRFAGKAFGPSPSFNAWAQKPMFTPTPPITNAPSKQLFQGDSAKNSILDWETSDPDFSTRYPPLLSLRKAKSVSGIHDKAQPHSSARDSLASVSALSRFPSINQFEQQNRPKSKPQPLTLKLDEALGSSSPSSTPKSTTYKKPTVEDACEQPPRQATNTGSISNQNRPGPSWSPTSLPGSWPEPKASDSQESPWATSATRTPLPAHSSYVPFHTDNPPVQALSVRLSSPVSETYSRAPIFPRRHQTVSSTNPAARLNGPFDPLANFPTLQPRPQKSQPDLKHSRDSTNGRSAFETPNIPGAFPQRSRTVHHTERYKPQPQPGTFNYSRPTLWEYYLRQPANNSVPSLSALPRPDNVQPGFQNNAPPSVASGAVHQHIFNLPSQRPMQPAAKPQPLVPQSSVRPESSAPNLASFATRPPRTVVTIPTSRLSYTPSSPPQQTPSASTAVEQCVQTLRSMGYGSDANELARLNVYAGAAAGNIEDAIEMIEEDREAAKELDESKDLEQIQGLDV